MQNNHSEGNLLIVKSMDPVNCDCPCRVLHVIGAMDRGGAETLIMNVYRNIDRSILQFDFLVHEARECDFDPEIRALGGSIFSIDRLNGINTVSYIKQCRDFFRTHHNYCAVHVHIGSSACFVIKEAKKYGLFCIAHSHNTNPSLSLPEIGFRLFSYPTRYIADYYLACSREAGVDRFGRAVVTSDRFSVLNNGIDVKHYKFSSKTRSSMRRNLGIAPEQKAICHIGRFSDEKNHEFLLKAFAKCGGGEFDGRLFLIGRGPLRNDMEQLAAELNIHDKVVFLGVRSDIPDLLMAMDLFVFPSKWEGLGIAAIEAQASGLPCILSPALPDMAVCSPYAYKMDGLNSTTTWAERMVDEPIRADMDRIDGANYVRESGFDIKCTVDSLISLYLDHVAI